jgi:hypothetical protein
MTDTIHTNWKIKNNIAPIHQPIYALLFDYFYLKV